ncbi:hypothetical protein Sme01_16060 [Sphaerisporangium melleum]|uniref:Uncharacterized protein n=1 Tax=Sphaerisporangium melleum TaxID=321316 RepID=A0A917RJI9_9ACTN|nr:hypothetical protein [Sphaerisporangium melleum]GGL10605.1 hypothetical protein GCM10007964_60980 [Sphaerisporangium melleum]GII69130.1 hypothetical protein Sme01_16060 [Sphaerisporangium melleum]
MTTPPVLSPARTRDEAHLYLDLHPCERCGSVDTTWEHALVPAPAVPTSPPDSAPALAPAFPRQPPTGHRRPHGTTSDSAPVPATLAPSPVSTPVPAATSLPGPTSTPVAGSGCTHGSVPTSARGPTAVPASATTPGSTHRPESGGLAARYAGVCRGCGAERAYLFGLPEHEPALSDRFPDFGGGEPSRLLDAGQWLWVADLTAGNVPAGNAAAARRALAIAVAAVEEVVKFVPPGAEEVPEQAFWTDLGRQVRGAEPDRFQVDRLLVVRDAYHRLAGRP